MGDRYTRTELAEVDARAVRRHAGTAMDAAYDIFRPISILYPDLNPAKSENPLGITKDEPPSGAAFTRELTLEAVERFAKVLTEQVPVIAASLAHADVSQIEKWASRGSSAPHALRLRLGLKRT